MSSCRATNAKPINTMSAWAEAQAAFDAACRGRDRAGREFVRGTATRDVVSVATDRLSEALSELARAEEAARAHLEGR